MEDFYYRKLNVYHLAMERVKEVYFLTKNFPKDELHGLTNQIRRAVISVPSNIAEGMGRDSIKERIHFLEIAYGSLSESMCQLEIAHALNYISTEQLANEDNAFRLLSRMLLALKKTLIEKNNKQQ